MRTRHFLSLVVVSALCRPGAAFAQTSGTMAAHHNLPMQPGGSMGGLLTSPLGSRGPSGTVTVTGATVQLAWLGDQPGAARAWSLRRGSCTRVEGIVGSETSYRALAVDAAGTAQGTATLDAPLDTDSAVIAVVHSLPNEANSPVLACGSISNGARRASGAPPVDRATTDHSTTDHSAMTAPGRNMSGAADSGSAGLRAIYLRMMADPVIRERVRTDPVLQRMMAALPAGEASITSTDMPAMTGVPASAPAIREPAAKRAPAPYKPTAKPKAKPAPDPMAGMDHSKMPGTRKPPT